MENKKRIALITAWFPPTQSIATNRMVAFADYLSEQFEVEVFTLGEKDVSSVWNGKVNVYYSGSNWLLNRLKSDQSDSKLKHKLKTLVKVIIGKLVKKPMNSWRKATLKKLTDRHQELPFEVIISSYAPEEAHLIALDFVQHFPSVSWVADMRDEMSKNPNLTVAQQAELRKIEIEINARAKAIISVSQPITDDFKSLCPKVSVVEEIRNGFNHSFQRDCTTPKNEVFTMGYFGTFYGTRKPQVLFAAIGQLMAENADFDCRIEIVGAHQNFDIPASLKGKVHLKPPMNYMDAIQYMATMDMNVLIHPRSHQKGVFTGKLFDYISVQRPVLALVDKEDVAAQLVREMNAGYVAECLDLEDNKAALLRAFNDWNNHSMPFASTENAQSLHRKYQVEQLAKLIGNLL